MSFSSIYNSFLFVTMLILPNVVLAQDVCERDGNPVVCNPLEAKSITEFLLTVVEVVVTLSIPVIALAIIYTGFLFVTAGGSKDQLDTAKTAAKYTLIGAGIIIGAGLIITVLQNTASGLGVDGV